MSNLHTEGWEQGSILSLDLEATHLTASQGRVREVKTSFAHWVVCTQDCDLQSADTESDQPLIELRPVFSDAPLPDWGIRSRRFRVTDDSYVDDSAPRCLVTPALLHHARGNRGRSLTDERTSAFKTWLGVRYDRPAIPDHLGELARAIAKACSGSRGREISDKVHDVLIQFDEGYSPTQVLLYGVIYNAEHRQEIQDWLATAGAMLPKQLGTVSAVRVGTRADISLELIENSFSADLSQLTWRRSRPA